MGVLEGENEGLAVVGERDGPSVGGAGAGVVRGMSRAHAHSTWIELEQVSGYSMFIPVGR